MTQAEYEKLSSREKDALVAEHIFKCNVVKGEYDYECRCGLDGDHTDPHADEYDPPWVAQYTQSIADAWTVVEKLPFRLELTQTGSGEWFAIFKGTKLTVDARAWEPDAPPAIALASLKAVGAIKEG